MSRRASSESISHEYLDARLSAIESTINGLDRLTDAKFVTFETLITGEADKVKLALTAANTAVDKAERAAEKRFDGVNEFRKTLSDQATMLMSRAEAQALISSLNNRLDEAIKGLSVQIADLKEYRAGSTASAVAGKQSITTMLAVIGAVVGVVGIALAIFANIGH